METSVLRSRESKGIPLDGMPVNVVVNDAVYIYMTQSGEIHLFDSVSLSDSILSPFDKDISSSIVSFDIVPSKNYIIFGYSDGSVLLYDVTTNKTLKALPKTMQAVANTVIALGDRAFLVCDGQNNMKYLKVAVSLFGVNVTETVIGRFKNMKKIISIPPIYLPSQLGSKSSSKCINSNLVDLVGISTDKSFILADVSSDFNVIIDLKVTDPVHSFFVTESGQLLVSVAHRAATQIMRYVSGSEYEELYTLAADKTPIISLFMTKSLLLRVDETNTASIIDFDHNSFTVESLPETGLLVPGRESLLVFNERKLSIIKLLTFAQLIEQLKEDRNMQGAIDLCRKAMKNDPTATIGLPASSAQRTVVLERELSVVLRDLTEDMFTDNKTPQEIADFLINLSQELGLREWIVREAPALFESRDCVNVLYSSIIEHDPSANVFTYNQNFIENLLRSSLGISMTMFLLCLSQKIAPAQLLLEHGLRVHDDHLISSILLRVNDPVSAARVYLSADKVDDFCRLIQSKVAEDSQDAVDLVQLIMTKEVKDSAPHYPYLEALYKSSSRRVLSMLKEVGSYIAESKTNFSPNDFADSLLIAMSSTEFDEVLFSYVVGYAQTNSVVLCPRATAYVLRVIFTNEKSQFYETLLEMLLSQGSVPKEAIIPLCEYKGYYSIKRKIQLEAGLYTDIVLEVLKKATENPFAVISDMIESGHQLDKIHESVSLLSPLLMAYDQSSFVAFFKSYFKCSLDLKLLKNSNQRNMYIRLSKTTDVKGFFIEDHVSFLCNHYPSETLGFLKTLDDKYLSDLIPICQRFNVLDACAYLLRETRDIQRANDYLILFLEYILDKYTEGKMQQEVFEEKLMFVMEFTKYIVSSDILDEDFNSFVTRFIESLSVFQFFCTRDNKYDMVAKLDTVLLQLCQTIVDRITYPVLIRLILESFEELKLQNIKNTINKVLEDYSYDVDSSMYLAELFNNDAMKAHSEHIERSVRGTNIISMTCITCSGLLSHNAGEVYVFSCGHCCHNTSKCLVNSACPLCNDKLRDVKPMDHFASSDGSLQTYKNRIDSFERLVTKREPDQPARIERHAPSVVRLTNTNNLTLKLTMS